MRNIFPRIIHIVVPADGDRGETRQIADNHLGRVDQLGGKLPVRDDDYSDQFVYPNPGILCYWDIHSPRNA
jgi:hypothetical protein